MNNYAVARTAAYHSKEEVTNEMCIERNEFKEHEIETVLLYNEYCFTPSIHTVMSSIMPTK